MKVKVGGFLEVAERTLRKALAGSFCVAVAAGFAGFPFSMTLAAMVPPHRMSSPQDATSSQDLNQREAIPPSNTNNEFSAIGDSVDLYTGRLTLRQTDLIIPGTGPEIRVERRWMDADGGYSLGNLFREMADWSLNIPRIEGFVPAPSSTPSWANNRCSAFDQIDFSTFYSNVTWPGALINQGFTLEYDGAQRTLARSTLASAPSGTVAITKDFIALSCVASISNGTGEGFQATLPDGTTILFNYLKYTATSPVTYPVSFPDGSFTYLPRFTATMYATKVTDRFGNHIDYNFDASGNMTSITGSDGRSVTFVYTSQTNQNPIYGYSPATAPAITSMTANGQTWTYNYATYTTTYGSAVVPGSVLRSISRPDGTQWTFHLTDVLENEIVNFQEGATISLTSPTNATASFSLAYAAGANLARGNVPKVQYNSYYDLGPSWTWAYKNIGVVDCYSKQVTGPGLSTLSWSWSRVYYPTLQGWMQGETPGATQKTVTTTSPEGVVEKFVYSIVFDGTEGELLERDTYENASAATPTSKAVYTYTNGTTVGTFSNPTLNGATVTQAPRPNTVTITQDGTSYTTHYTSFDTYNNPLTIDRSNDFTSTVTETRTYNNDTTSWVLGELASSALGSTAAIGYTYYSGTDQVHETYSFGRKVYTYTYNADGTLLTRTDGNSNATTYSNYYRGIAQSTQYADTRSLTLTVNGDGTVATLKSPRGYTTTYGYDGLGRLNSVTYPSSDTVAWSNRTITYANITAAELGMPIGTWRVRTTEGSMQRSDYYDGLTRLVLREEKDTSSSTAIYTRMGHDSAGRVTFSSYPSSSSSASAGINISYDALGRETGRSTTDGVTFETVTFQSNDQRKVKDASGNETTYSYQAFGSPDNTNVTEVDAPEGQTTTIARDNFGHMTSATQSGVGASQTRTYIYDSNFRVCKSIDPERGQTVTHYDAAGQVDWTAEGQSGSASTCDYTSVPASAQVGYVYSTVGRRTNINYPDATGNITFGYDDDGHLTSVSNPTATWTYTYNKRGLLETEKLVIDSRTLTLKRDHNSQGLESQLTYPDNRVIALSPDAWGRPTQLGSYASSITYYPNNIPHTYSLGNGLSYTAGINSRQWLSSAVVGSQQNLSYSYSDDGDLQSITDAIDGSDSASIKYDGLHRIRTASGCWGTYAYNYDSNNNLLSRDGTNPQFWTYDGANRLSQTGAGGDGVFFDGFDLAACRSAGPQVRGYSSYNAQGQPTSVAGHTFSWNLADQLTSISSLSTYSYDGRGKRAKVLAGGTVTEYAFYDQNGRIAYTDRNAVLTDFLYLAGKPFAQVSSAGVTYLHPDLLGSPRIATDGSATQLWHEHYDPFGAKQDVVVTEKLGYSGHSFDVESGFVYAQARYYDAGAARFLSTDSKGFAGTSADSFNRYAYGNNGPYNYHDPDGRQVITVNTTWNPAQDQANVWVLPAAAVGVGAVFLTIETGGLIWTVAGDTLAVGLPGAIALNGPAITTTGVLLVETGAGVATGAAVPSVIAQNAAAGRAFEEKGLEYLRRVDTDVAPQVSVRPYSGPGEPADFIVRLDALSTPQAGGKRLSDFKSSETAGFTKNQTVGYPMIQQYGGRVVGDNGGDAYPAGTEIPPSPVDIFRPNDIP